MPCPLCGGLVHPIAGRCKHCKADLGAHRGARPAAAAALPTLTPGAAPTAPGSARPDATPAPGADVIGAAPPAHARDPIAAAIATDTILPPRPTGGHAAAAPRSAWRSWPVIVMVISAIAIVAAIALMLWPPAPEASAGPRTLPPPPAPERGGVAPVLPTPSPGAGGVHGQAPPPGGGVDPWGARPGDPPAGTVPRGPDAYFPPVDPDPDDLAQDPFGLGGSPLGGTLGPGALGAYGAVAARACKKLAGCSPDLAQYCAVIDMVAPSLGAMPSCPAAQTCLQKIDGLSCGNLQGGSSADLLMLMATLQDCLAVSSC